MYIYLRIQKISNDVNTNQILYPQQNLKYLKS